jgi:hypothetical protein
MIKKGNSSFGGAVCGQIALKTAVLAYFGQNGHFLALFGPPGPGGGVQLSKQTRTKGKNSTPFAPFLDQNGFWNSLTFPDESGPEKSATAALVRDPPNWYVSPKSVKKGPLEI